MHPITVTAHIQGQGDVTSDSFVGTRGQHKRLEGFLLHQPPHGLNVEYMAHGQVYGDTAWHSQEHFVGTRAESKRLEGFAIRLQGHHASHYTIKYIAHVQGTGDVEGQDGSFVGTRGQGKEIEGMQVWVEERK